MRKVGAPVLVHRKGRVTATCAQCGLIFETIKSQMERRGSAFNNKFHSRDCWREWHRTNKMTSTAKHIKQKYRMSMTEFATLLERQDGVCGICRRSSTEVGLHRLAVDHDHVTKRVRGLLCITCNLGLERFRDSQTLLVSAIRYLDHPPAI